MDRKNIDTGIDMKKGTILAYTLFILLLGTGPALSDRFDRSGGEPPAQTPD